MHREVDNSSVGWKIRNDKYENVLHELEDPSPKLLERVGADLKRYLSDVNTICQKTALSICERYFELCHNVHYVQIAEVLIGRCFDSNRPANTSAATALLLICIHNNRDIVLQRIFDELNSKSRKVVCAMISVLVAQIQVSEKSEADVIRANLSPLLEHRDGVIRTAVGQVLKEMKPPRGATARSAQPASRMIRGKPREVPERAHSPNPRLSPRKGVRLKLLDTKSTWAAWIEPGTLRRLQGSLWEEIDNGLDAVRSQYENSAGNPAACVYGLATLFTRRMFQPRIMKKIIWEMRLYLKDNKERLGEEVVTPLRSFIRNKITERKFEAELFELADLVGKMTSINALFTGMYPDLYAKNPQLVERTVTYMVHAIPMFRANASINCKEIIEKVTPLCDHSDQSVRKMARICLGEVAKIDKNATLSRLPGEMRVMQGKRGNDFKRKGLMTGPVPHIGLDDDVMDNVVLRDIVRKMSNAGTEKPSRRDVERLEKELTRILDANGPSSVSYDLIDEVLAVLRPAFSESNTTIILSVIRTLSLSLCVVESDDVIILEQSVLSDMFLLLQIEDSEVRSESLAVLSRLYGIHSNFALDVLTPALGRMSIDGKIAVLNFVAVCVDTMSVGEFLPFVVECLTLKRRKARKAARPIIKRFLELPGAEEAIMRAINSYDRVKKAEAIAMMHSEEEDTKAKKVNLFIEIPTESARARRQKKMDPFVPMRVMNGAEPVETLSTLVKGYCGRYLSIEIGDKGGDISEIQAVGSAIIDATGSDFEAVSCIIDIIFLWWVHQGLHTKHRGEFNAIFDFLKTFLDIVADHDRALHTVEISIILPIVLEYVGGEYDEYREILEKLKSVTKMEVFLRVLVYVLGNVESVYTLQAVIDTLIELLPSNNWEKVKSELCETVVRLQKTLMQNSQPDRDLCDACLKLMSFLEAAGAIDRHGENKGQGYALHRVIVAKVGGTDVQIYQWLADLSSHEKQVQLQALKTISRELEKNAGLFELHMEVLGFLTVNLMHNGLVAGASEERITRYSAFCLLSLLNETAAKRNIASCIIRQVVCELLTYHGSGNDDSVLNGIMKELMVKVIDEHTVSAFRGVLHAVGHYDQEGFKPEAIGLGLKFFEACQKRIMRIGRRRDIREAVVRMDKFVSKHTHDRLIASPLGTDVHAAIMSFVTSLCEQFPAYIHSDTLRGKLNPDSSIMAVINSQSEVGKQNQPDCDE